MKPPGWLVVMVPLALVACQGSLALDAAGPAVEKAAAAPLKISAQVVKESVDALASLGLCPALVVTAAKK